MNPDMSRTLYTLLALLALSCGEANDGDDLICDAYGLSEVATDSNTPATRADVEAILVRSCALGGCHAAASRAGELGLPLGGGAWVDELVNRPSLENPELLLVAPGRPEDSWLMHKITGNYCAFACDGSLGCGQRMPAGAPLAQAEIDTIYAWVQAGTPR
jgi:hypothetical protein